jgi:hypothetical protein
MLDFEIVLLVFNISTRVFLLVMVKVIYNKHKGLLTIRQWEYTRTYKESMRISEGLVLLIQGYSVDTQILTTKSLCNKDYHTYLWSSLLMECSFKSSLLDV